MLDLKKLYGIWEPYIKKEETIPLAWKFNIILVISKYSGIEAFASELEIRGFNIKYTDSSNFIILKTSYTDQKTREEIPVIYYLFIDKENNLLVFLTSASKLIIERTLYAKVIDKISGLYYSWISPNTLQTIKKRIFYAYPDTTIPYFSVARRATYKLQTEIRPYADRGLEYRGSDGREALEEFIQIYGMLPKIIEFDVVGKAKFKLDVKGIFSFLEGDINFLAETFEFVIDTLLASKTIVEKSKFVLTERTRKDGKVFVVPQITQWQIKLGRKIDYEDIGSVTKSFENAHFIAIDNFAEKGSLFWTATIIDFLKNSVFSIKSDGEELFILPKYNCQFDSFLRFYEFFADNVDPSAVIASSDANDNA
ncbi:MAG: hypothetical protein QXH07_03005 [Thermoplasmata archaeon]